MFVMEEDEWKSFIMAGTRTGKLATTKPNGDPHVVPIWFVMDGKDIVFSSGETTVKTKNLKLRPRASLCVDSEVFPFAFVMLECDAKIEYLTPDELPPYTTAFGKRYVGADRAEEYGLRNGIAGEVLIRLRPTKVIPWGGMSD